MSPRRARPRAAHIVVVGRGRLGSSLARALRGAGWGVSHWPGRGPWPLHPGDLDLVLVAVSDPHVRATATKLAAYVGARTITLHASGALGPEALAPLSPRSVGVLHPLVSFASARAPTLRGASAVIAGDARARRAARRVTAALGVEPIAASIHGPRYHAAAALVANGAAALATRAVGALVREGISRRAAERAVAGLLRSVADNVRSVGTPAALTGPIVRGDAATITAHRAALDATTRRAYDAVAPIILEVAREAGLPASSVRAVRSALGSRSSAAVHQSRK